MKKFNSMLSLVALVVSALFVSCAEKKQPDLIPAFPSKKVATYTLNTTDGTYAWKYDDTYKYTNAKGGGFQISKFKSEYLEYVVVPNADWSVKVEGSGAHYVEVCLGYGYSNENYNFASSVSGLRGLNTLCFRVIKTPEAYEEDLECVISMAMEDYTMPIATLVIQHKVEAVVEPENPEETPEDSDNSKPVTPENPEGGNQTPATPAE